MIINNAKIVSKCLDADFFFVGKGGCSSLLLYLMIIIVLMGIIQLSVTCQLSLVFSEMNVHVKQLSRELQADILKSTSTPKRQWSTLFPTLSKTAGFPFIHHEDLGVHYRSLISDIIDFIGGA